MAGITKEFKGVGSVHEVRATVKAFERLGFGVSSVQVWGAWNHRGSIIHLGINEVGVPVKKVEIAGRLFLDPTEDSYMAVTGERADVAGTIYEEEQ